MGATYSIMKFTIIVSILILIAVLIPGSNIPDVNVVGIDKIVHISMFFTWAVAFRFDLKSKFSWKVALISGLSFSLLTEVLQILAEGRSFDLLDIAADGVGLLLGIALSKRILSLIYR